MNTLIIEKENLIYNIDQIKKFANKSGKDDKGNYIKIIAVVKGNGYGLGIVKYTKLLIDNGISFFAVSTVEEALILRNAGIKEEILMLSPIAIKEELVKLINSNIIITIGSKEDVQVINEISEETGKKIRTHLKIDTGFGRYGFVYSKRDEMIENVKQLKNVEIEGTFSHFSMSFCNKKYTNLQFQRFLYVIEVLKMNDIETGLLHICNSSAFLKYPNMHLNAVRIGSVFLGRLIFENKIGLKKIGYLESKVSEIKELPKDFYVGYGNAYKIKKNTQIAIIPCGNMAGINMVNDRDMFRTIDKLRYIVRDVKDFFKKQEKFIKINNKNCRIIGRIGTFHLVCDITETNIKIGDIAKIQINPKFVDSIIEREYR